MRLLLILWALPLLAADYCEIRVIDAATRRGVPLVELRATNHLSVFTDSNGVVAWNEPGLMERDVYFAIQSPGYHFPGGGRTVRTTRGARVELRIHRQQVAERLYRLTGQGIYRDSLLTGRATPLREPALNAGAIGMDTVRVAPYQGRLFWLWGDTDRPDGPLGNFNTTAATSRPPDEGGLDPSAGVDFEYFARDGFVKPMIPWTGRMTWMHALMTLPDPAGRERLLAYYEVIRSLGHPERAGLAVFNDETKEFDRLVEFDQVPPFPLEANASPVRVGGRPYYYFHGLRPGLTLRVPAEWDAVRKPGAFQLLDAATGAWVRATLPVAPAPAHRDAATGAPLKVHIESYAWNPYRQRWIVLLQVDPGEIWYAEADSPAGPVVYAARVATHGKYTYYWPLPHPEFDQQGGRLVYFEGTYTDAFSGNPVVTPRYNYNQLMYRLDLADERLFLPAPVYRLRDGRLLMREAVAAEGLWTEIASIPFFALPLDRPRAGSLAIRNLFRALPPRLEAPPLTLAGVYACRASNGLDLGLTFSDRVEVDILGRHFEAPAPDGGRFQAEFQLGQVTYHLAGALRAGQLEASWPEQGGGTLTCARPEPARPLFKTLLPLYEHNGELTLEPHGQAIAQVWPAPPSALALDRDAAASKQP